MSGELHGGSCYPVGLLKNAQLPLPELHMSIICKPSHMLGGNHGAQAKMEGGRCQLGSYGIQVLGAVYRILPIMCHAFSPEAF